MCRDFEQSAVSNSSLIPNLIGTLEFCLIPAGVEIIFGLLGLLFKPNPKFVSGVQHLAAGVITSVVSIELVPILLSSLDDSIYNYIALVVGFVVAVSSLSYLSYYLPCQICDDDCRKLECDDKKNCGEKEKCGKQKSKDKQDEVEKERSKTKKVNNDKKTLVAKSNVKIYLKLIFQ